MSTIVDEMTEYIESADDAVKSSIKQIPDIEIDGYNAEGCNGYVFFGNHQIFRKKVAVKYYYFGENSHEEVTLLKSIKHKNILPIWDAHTVGDGWAYFITDKMDNGTLDSLLSSRAINSNQAVDIVRGLLSGVGKMHEAPNYLLHRDLKPANILLDNNGNPVIADFGSVKRLPQNADRVIASRHSALYRPPEVYEQGYYFCQSDIYQIGMVMYQLLGGQLSYDSLDHMTVNQGKRYYKLPDDFSKSKYIDEILYNKARTARLLCLDSLPYYTHPKLIAIIRKATHPDITRRYQNTSEYFLHIHQLGSIPNWVKLDDESACCEYKASFYRVTKSGKGYLLEKSKDGAKWRKIPGAGYEDNEADIYSKALSMIC